MWDLPRPGFEPVSPALAGGFLTTAPPGKSLTSLLTSRKLTPLCVTFFNFLPTSTHLLPKFCLDLQSVFSCSSLASGGPPSFQGSLLSPCPWPLPLPLCLFWCLYWCDQVLFCFFFASSLSLSLQTSPLQLIKSSTCLHSEVFHCLVSPTGCCTTSPSLSSSVFQKMSSALACFHASTHFHIFPSLFY